MMLRGEECIRMFGFALEIRSRQVPVGSRPLNERRAPPHVPSGNMDFFIFILRITRKVTNRFEQHFADYRVHVWTYVAFLVTLWICFGAL